VEENGKNMCYNMYDVRLKDEYPSCGMAWPPDLTSVTPYLRRKDVTTALHVNEEKRTGWQECNGNVGSAFRARTSEPSVKLLPDLLDEVPIILFSGEQDLICNHLGTEELINNLEWSGGKGMEVSPGVWAPRRAWTFEGEPAGFYQEARNLTYILFFNSSHMVPFDFPRRTRDMLDRFMGVDIASIGGKPTDSRIDGEKAPSTSVGAHPNSTAVEQEQADKLKQAEWKAYYKSGEVALVVVAIAAAAWGWYVWTARRKRSGYQGVLGDDPSEGRGGPRIGLQQMRVNRTGGERDVEAADFDENELEILRDRDREQYGDDLDDGRHRYSLGGDSEEDEDEGKANGKAQANGHGR
jgi:carboxypeptidase D